MGLDYRIAPYNYIHSSKFLSPSLLPSVYVLLKPPINRLVHSLLALNSQVFTSDHLNEMLSGHRQEGRLFKEACEVPINEAINFTFEVDQLEFVRQTLKLQAIRRMEIFCNELLEDLNDFVYLK